MPDWLKLIIGDLLVLLFFICVATSIKRHEKGKEEDKEIAEMLKQRENSEPKYTLSEVVEKLKIDNKE